MTAALVVGNAELVAAAALIVMCVGYYHVSTAGRWRHTETGWHLMAFMVALAGVLLLSVVRIVSGNRLDVPWFAWLRVTVFAGVPLVFAWRLRIMVRAQRRGRGDGGADRHGW